MFHRLLLSGRVIPLDEMPIVIVAHSMGGVVVRKALDLHVGRVQKVRISRGVTIARPIFPRGAEILLREGGPRPDALLTGP